jgi:hypothetical protein
MGQAPTPETACRTSELALPSPKRYNSGVLIRRSLLALCLVAAAGFLAASASSASASAKRTTSAETGCAASPSAPEAVVAGDRTLPGSGLDGVCAAARSDVWQPALAAATASTVARQSFLIEAKVLEKYRSFRESLSSP